MKNFLYENPSLYDCFYKSRYELLVNMFERLSLNDDGSKRKKLLDIGCGTGVYLNDLRDTFECIVGYDINEPMIKYGKSKTSGINLFCGDFSNNEDLKGSFDLVTAFGSVISYMHTNDELIDFLSKICSTLSSGGVFVASTWNSLGFLNGEKKRHSKTIHSLGSNDYSAEIEYDFDLDRQLLLRKRIWKNLHDKNVVAIDDASYRLLFPLEIRAIYEISGLSVLGIYSSSEFKGNLSTDGPLYIVANKNDNI